MGLVLPSGFWDDGDYSRERYVGRPATDADIADAEALLGFKLPSAYCDLVREHNGGIVRAWQFVGQDGTVSWLEGLYGIDPECPHSLLSNDWGTAFWVDEWEYPSDIGLVIADTPSGGHDLLFLDYRKCGPQGEPGVVHVDNELRNAETHLADSFEEFLAGLRIPEDEDSVS